MSRLLRKILKVFNIIVILGLLFVQDAHSISSVLAFSGQNDSADNIKYVEDINPGTASSSPDELKIIDNSLFFSADDGVHGRELWKSDPPFINATLIADINEGSKSSQPNQMTMVDDVLFFSAHTEKNGEELWKSVPPYNNAELVTNINYGDRGAYPMELTAIGTTLFFTADDGVHGTELWKCEAPYTNVKQVADVRFGSEGSSPKSLTSVGWILFFIADDGDNRSELWKTEPPYNSASKVTNIYPQENADISELTVIGTTLFFNAQSKDSGYELWKSVVPYGFEDTTRVTDLSGKPESLSPRDLIAVGDTLFFSGYHMFYGYELWKSVPPYEATTTTRITDLFPSIQGANPDKKMVVGNTLIFSAYEPGNGTELYKITPPYTDSQIMRIAETYKDGGSSQHEDLTAINSTIFFTARDSDSNGRREVWKADPPYFHPQKLTNTATNPESAIDMTNPYSLTTAGNTLLFGAGKKGYGIELFKIGRTDGYFLPNTGFQEGVITDINPQPAEKAYQDMGNLSLSIPALNAEMPLVGVPPSIEGWDLTWLNYQAGYLTDTAFPTFEGNTVITGHLYLPSGKPGPFINLDKLKWGDQVVIQAWNMRYIYEVRAVKNVSRQDLSVMGHKEEDWITLITCRTYDEKQGDYLERTAIQAVLVRVEEDR